MSWQHLPFHENNTMEINLNLTLKCGQAFRWHSVGNEWRCGFDGFILRLKQDFDGSVYFHSTDESRFQIFEFLTEYFRCKDSLSSLLIDWKSSDTRFDDILQNFTGIRLLKQSPVENLFSFICSSNNNISRISKLVCSLATNFGRDQYLIEDNHEKTSYPSFPSINDLCVDDLEASLRNLGFGYRSKYIKNTALMLQKSGGEKKLLELRNESYETAKEFLVSLSGVGSKVADCVLLGSLEHLDSVPIDVHMFNVAKKHYSQYLSPEIRQSKSLTASTYAGVKKMFNDIWTPNSGWAQLLVFASDLKPSRFDSVAKGHNKRKKNLTNNEDVKRMKK